MKNAIFLSDNYYLCQGVSCSRFNVRLIRDSSDIDSLYCVSPFWDFIIAIEQDNLRNRVIKQIKALKSKYIVLLDEIEPEQHVKIDNVIYSSLHFKLQPLQQLVSFFSVLKPRSFTPREIDVLKLFHLENHKIASRLKLSQKTTSTYRGQILEKLNVRTKNTLAMHRIKSAIIDQKI